MLKVSPRNFELCKSRIKFYKLELEMPVATKADTEFYGCEVGKDVQIVQLWNNDFCTASFVLNDAIIVECNGKYTVVSSNESILDDDLKTEEFNTEASLEDRFAAIDASDADDTIVIRDIPNHQIKQDFAETIIEAAKDNVQVAISTSDRPIMAKGRQKPEETVTPAPAKIITHPAPPIVPREYEKPKPVNWEASRKVSQPAPANDDFGGW